MTWLAKRNDRSSRWRVPIAGGAPTPPRRIGPRTRNGWSSASSAVSAGDMSPTGRPGEPGRGISRRRGENMTGFAASSAGSSRWLKRPAWESVLEEMGNPVVRAEVGRFPHRMAARIACVIRSAVFRGEGGPSPAALRAASAREGLSPQPGRGASGCLSGRGVKASSSIGRAPVSKTGGWGFDPLLACHPGARHPGSGRPGGSPRRAPGGAGKEGR